MEKELLNEIKKTKAEIVVFDIDGTLKDLCAEHSSAVKLSIAEFANCKKIRKKLILSIDKLAMSTVKTGLLPTNHIMQNVLIFIYSIVLNVRFRKFKKVYFAYYKKELRLFDGAVELIEKLNKSYEVYFATINKQNYNLEACGIGQDKIIYVTDKLKKTTYSKFIKCKGVDRAKVIIVGDNVFDDMLSAKIIKTKHILVNNYNSKIKKIICRLLNGRYLKE